MYFLNIYGLKDQFILVHALVATSYMLGYLHAMIIMANMHHNNNIIELDILGCTLVILFVRKLLKWFQV